MAFAFLESAHTQDHWPVVQFEGETVPLFGTRGAQLEIDAVIDGGEPRPAPWRNAEQWFVQIISRTYDLIGRAQKIPP
jgi:hypothetical protein